MRLVLLTFVVAVLGIGAKPVFADDIVILPPLGAAKDAKAVSAALAKGGVGKLAPQAVNASCVEDPGCLAKTGNDLNANRIVAITAQGGGKLDVIVVDVGAKILLGTRTLTFAPKKLNKELGPALSKLVEEVTVEKSKALFAEGNEHYNLGEFTQALERYKLAYQVKALPAFQFNIAQCHRKLGQNKEA